MCWERSGIALFNSRISNQPAIFKLTDGHPLIQRLSQTYEALARRAYELFEARGHQDGHDLEDWLRAESELLNPMPVEIVEADDHLIVRADVPGFGEKDIEVGVEPHHLVISGKREQISDNTKQTLYAGKSNEICRMFNFPEEIDSDKVRATRHDGTLEVVLPKAHDQKKGPIAVKAA